MQAKHVVVVVIDRLGASWLGPYGNTWLETPHFNRLAAESLVCETVIADSPDLTQAYRCFWTGQHVLKPDAPAKESSHSPSLALQASMRRSILITDDERISGHPLATGFQEIRRVSAPVATAAARSVEETGLFQLTAMACEALAGAGDDSLVWIHSRGMDGPWDAPLELRNQFADEDDPEPPQFVKPPEQMLAEAFDPDELLGITQAYAGQVALVDECLGLLLAALDEHPQRDETLLIVTSPRGYPLGEHRRIGPCDDALYAELLQVPLLVRFPGRAGGLMRSQAIVQPQSVFATIAGSPPGRDLSRLLAGEPLECGDCAVATAKDQRAIRTPAWFLRQSKCDGEMRSELFAKPDDRFELNEIALRCGEAAELLAARLDEFESAARAGGLAELPPLAELLADVWR